MTYLIDVNLPASFSHIKTINCVFIKDISDEMTDNKIWKMAVDNNNIILTRDKDFYYRALQSVVLPKIVLFRLGNCRSKELREYLKQNLSIIESHLISHQVLVLWPDEIQIVI